MLYPSLAVLTAFFLAFAVWIVWSLPAGIDRAGHPIGNDFMAFWSAARLALAGRPEAAYDPATIRHIYGLIMPQVDFDLPWLYPPTFLLFILPLGALPYFAAVPVYLLATVAFWGALICRMFDDRRAWIVAAAFPAGLWNFANGQNGFVTAGLAGFAFLALERQPIVAGVLVGLLAIKPHLAVLFPLALAADRRWSMFAAAAATTVALTLLSVAAFGWDTMQSFFRELTLVRGWLDDHQWDWQQLQSVYVSARSWGLSPAAAMSLHAAVAFGAAGCVYVAWRDKRAPPEAKFATLAAASMLISPYLFFYDFTWVGLAIAWLVKLCWRTGFRRGERELLAAAWICSASLEITKVTGLQLGCVVPLCLMALGTLRALRAHSAEPAQPHAPTAASQA